MVQYGLSDVISLYALLKLLAEHGGVRLLLAPFHPVLKHLGMSVYSGYALLAGLLCGYPMGMKTAADFNRKSLLSAHEKRLLTAISASPSPMFIAGYAAPRLNPAVPSNYLVLALYTPLLLVGSLLCIYNKVTSFTLQNRFFSKETGSVKPARTKSTSVSVPASFDTILMDCIELQVRIGGLIMLYSILATFADAFCSGTLRLVLIGTAEMTTGIDAIARSGAIFSIPVQSGAMAACAAFGGLSGIAQTNSVIRDSRKDREKMPDFPSGIMYCGNWFTPVSRSFSLFCCFAGCRLCSGRCCLGACVLLRLGHDTASQLIAVGRYDIVAGLHRTHVRLETALRALHRIA